MDDIQFTEEEIEKRFGLNAQSLLGMRMCAG